MLGERGYAPCAESGEIRMRNCPFHHLVDNHRDLVCGLNHALLDAVVRTSRAPLDAALEPHADRCCVVLRPRAVSR
jgi:predicted ArsR family transcriptional regulator